MGCSRRGRSFLQSLRLSWHQSDQQSQGQGMIPIGYQGFREGGAGPAQVFRGAICAIGVYFPLRFAGWQQKAQECSCKCARTVHQKRVRIRRCTRVVYTRRVLQSPTGPCVSLSSTSAVSASASAWTGPPPFQSSYRFIYVFLFGIQALPRKN